MSTNTRKVNSLEESPRTSMQQPTVEQILSELPAGGITDTASTLMDVYESVERSYRAAAMAGEVQPRAAQSTNY
jgi:hypothetical protein